MENTMNAPAGKDYSSLYTPLAIVVAGIAVAVGLYFGLGGRPAGPVDQGGAPAAVDIKDVKTDGEPFIGSPDAPLTMAVWEDYQCPFCKHFETTVLPSLVKQYVETGKLRIVFKDFQFLGSDSMAAGEYARAIWDLYPGRYAAWRAAMYDAQDDENAGFGDAASIDKLIRSQFPQIDLAKVKARVATEKAAYDAAMAANQQEGQSFGINGTPGAIIGTTLINGAQPLSSFTAAIDAQLK